MVAIPMLRIFNRIGTMVGYSIRYLSIIPYYCGEMCRWPLGGTGILEEIEVSEPFFSCIVGFNFRFVLRTPER